MPRSTYFEDDLAIDRSTRSGWVIGAIIIATLLIIGYFIFSPPSPFPEPATALSTVKVIVPSGTGSGVNIGDGYILTAGHVAADLSEVDIKTSTGATTKATVLWVNKAYDISLLRLESDSPMASAPLSCSPLETGQPLAAVGNPLDLEFVTTTGHVAGSARKYGPWHSVVPVDMVIIQGMSGGPSFNVEGEVAGINVGVMAAPTDMGLGTDSGIGYVVPAAAVCELLDRQ